MRSNEAHPEMPPVGAAADPLALAFDLAATPLALAAADGTLTRVNPAMRAALAAGDAPMTGRALAEVIHPEDRERVLSALRPALAGDTERCRVEARWLRADGSALPAAAEAVAANGATVLRIDPAGSARVGETADEAEGAIRWVVGTDGAVRYAAAATSGMLGIDPAGLVGEAWDARLHPDDRHALRALMSRMRDDAGAVARVTARFAGPDGWRRFDLSAASAIDDPAIAGIVLDLRPADEAGPPPADGAATAKPSRARAARPVAPESADVLALVSHEFRTPLTSIQGYSELIAGPITDPAEVADFAAIIHQEANRLAQLIDDMLLLDQLASRRIDLNVVETNLNGVVREVVERVQPTAPAHAFALNLHPELPPIPADRDRLVQAVTCLVSNAVKFSPGGEIGIRTGRDRKRAILEVIDHGVGIPAEALERIFERFHRVDSPPNRALGGRGLGLSLVREIVRLHGGRVWAESTEGAGSTFRVALPLRASAALAAD